MKLKALLVAMVAMVGIFIATPAHASFNCNTGMLCLYNDANYAGVVTAYSNPALGCYSLSGTSADNNISSIHNYTSHRIRMDIGYSCSNFFQADIGVGQSWANLAGSGWNDTFSSFQVLSN